MGKIIAVCSSTSKGVRKENIGQGVLKQNYGLEGDAHADSISHRQASLLAMSSIQKMRQMGYAVNPGDFAENLTTDGIDLLALAPGSRLLVGAEVLLEITQIGKECHSGCAIFKQVGQCIMPKEGVFARVLRGGPVKTDDEIKLWQGQGKISKEKSN